MVDWLKNVADKDTLADNLTFTALFIAIYEHMVEYVVSNIDSFLNDISIYDGKIVQSKSKKYKSEILNRVVDEKGNKDKTKASFLWLVDRGAITTEDYKKFLDMKAIRNKYAHDMTQIICEGIKENEIVLLVEMHLLYSTITNWFFTEIEAPIMGYEISENTGEFGVLNAANYLFEMVLDVLYRGKSEEYIAALSSIRQGKNI